MLFGKKTTAPFVSISTFAEAAVPIAKNSVPWNPLVSVVDAGDTLTAVSAVAAPLPRLTAAPAADSPLSLTACVSIHMRPIALVCAWKTTPRKTRTFFAMLFATN